MYSGISVHIDHWQLIFILYLFIYLLIKFFIKTPFIKKKKTCVTLLHRSFYQRGEWHKLELEKKYYERCIMYNISRQREVIKILLLILFTFLFTYCILVLFTLRAEKELWKHNGSPFNLPSALCPLEKYCLVYSLHIIRFTFLTTEKQIPQHPVHVLS